MSSQVLDVTDHVWTEVWLPSWGRWVHCDPCENVLDAPLLYEKGWGKQLSYVFAFGRRGCTDVAPRYAADWRATLGRRTWVREGWLELTISTLNASRGAADLDASAAADRAQLAELTKPAEERAAAAAAAGGDHGGDKEAEARGRQTGSLEWRRARGETRE